MRLRRPRSLSPLRHGGFRLLVGGQVASNVGDAFYAVALPWYVLADHGGALLLATVLAAYGVPRTVLLAVGGHASDRWRPWTVMMVADGTRGAAVGLMALVAASGPANLAYLIPIATVMGAGEGIFLPGSFSIIPSLLPDSDLQAGNALASSGTQLATLVGPALGGVLVALAGPSPAFALDAVSFLISALTLAGIRGRQPLARPAPRREQQAQEVAQAAARPMGLRQILRSEPVVWIILATTLTANLGTGGMGEVALPALVHGPLHAGASGYGALIAALAAGALLGTICAGQLRSFRRPAIVGSAAFLLEAGTMALVLFSSDPLELGVLLAAFGATNGFGNVLTITAFQRWAPPQLLGRLTGILLLCSFGTFPVSVIMGGLVVHWLGPRAFFPIAAAPLAAALLAALSLPAWRRFGATDTGGATGAEPAPPPA